MPNKVLTNTLVQYTDAYEDIVSDAVQDAYFNKNTGDLTLNLNGTVYGYTAVPVWVYEGLKKADSVGRYYHNNIRGRYPSNYLGGYRHVTFLDASPVPVPTQNMTSMTATQGATMNVTAWPVNASSIAVKRHAVAFEAGGKRKIHTLYANSSDAAVEAVKEFGKLLDLDFKVKEVTTYYE